MKPRTLALIGSGAAVLALGIAVPTIALAEEPNPSPSAAITVPGVAQHQDRMAELLAAELDLPKDEVAAALEKVRTQLHGEAREERHAALEERLNAAVEEGTLTREQADAILAAAEAGVLGGHGMPGGRRGPGHHGW
jgi:hypothetical protein